MISVYVKNIKEWNEDACFEEKMNLLPEFRKQQVQKYKEQDDRIRCAGAYFLLLDALTVWEKRDVTEAAWTYNAYGKPFLKDHGCLHFNISHSGQYVALVLGNEEVGIDIQEMKGFKAQVAERFFHEEEKKAIHQEQDEYTREILFYRIWTRKEAYVKFLGEGMRIDPVSYNVLNLPDVLFMDYEKFPGYMMSVCKTGTR